MGIFSKLFQRGKKQPEPLFCDICRQSVYLIPEGSPLLIPPGVVMDYSKGKAYTVCGTCQLKLGLQAAEPGFLIHEIRDGYGYVDIDMIEKAIRVHDSNHDYI